MKPLVHVAGPRDAGPGEREEMLHRARAAIDQLGVPADAVTRFDVVASTSDDGEGAFRTELAELVPALQSGSLFGERRAVLLVDAQNLRSGEAAVLAELIEQQTEDVVLVLVAAGALPKPLAGAIKGRAETLRVKKLRERDAAEWLGAEARARRLKLAPDAAAALIQRFGSDVAALGQALDQLATLGRPVTAADVADRFRNRPDAPMWHLVDAISDGNVGEALRRLADFLTHGHPLQLLGFLENDLRTRALASAAPDIETLAEWLGSSPEHYPVKKAWRARGRASDSSLRAAVSALRRADGILKSAPEDLHRLTMERLTVALCRWYGGARRAS